jgi:cupin 2 domain-containing protein
MLGLLGRCHRRGAAVWHPILSNNRSPLKIKPRYGAAGGKDAMAMTGQRSGQRVAGNLLADVPSMGDLEIVEVLAGGAGWRVERILSQGHKSPDGFWYDQVQDEWVTIVSGAARLRFADGRVLEMTAGDYVQIPAHCRHRVDWTDPDRVTIWLAVHIDRRPRANGGHG